MTKAPTTTRADRRRADVEFERILRERDLRTLFQPIVHLESGAVVGYEALVRGPEGSVLASAGPLLAAANRAGQLAEFDWMARSCACRTALDAAFDPNLLLFLNIEPIALDSECPRDLWPAIEEAFATLRVVLEVTERSLDRDPGTLLDGIERRRPQVAGIALDDVGTNPATVAMLPLVAPAIIKLDAPVVQSPPDEHVARIANAVVGQAARTGAIVLAEGIETVEHRRQAVAYGAQLGQGLLLGDAGPLPTAPRAVGEAVRLSPPQPLIVASPFEVLPEPSIGPAPEALVAGLIRYVGTIADAMEPTLHVLLMESDRLDSAERDRLTRLADRGTFVAVLGPGVPTEPGPGIRGTGQRGDPPPIAQWAAITVSPVMATAVVARPIPDQPGSWEYGITHDWSRAIAAARCLVRLLGAPEPRFPFEG